MQQNKKAIIIKTTPAYVAAILLLKTLKSGGSGDGQQQIGCKLVKLHVNVWMSKLVWMCVCVRLLTKKWMNKNYVMNSGDNGRLKLCLIQKKVLVIETSL